MSDRLLILVLVVLTLAAAVGVVWLAIARRRVDRAALARTPHARAAKTTSVQRQPAAAPGPRPAAPPARAPAAATPQAPVRTQPPGRTAAAPVARPPVVERTVADFAETRPFDPTPSQAAAPRPATPTPRPRTIEPPPPPPARSPSPPEARPPAPAIRVTPPPVPGPISEPPAAAARPLASPAVASAPPPIASEGRMALVADDSAVVRVKLKKALETAGWQVTMAQDGVQALELLDQQRFDLLITDLEMPRLDGRGLIAAVQDRPAIAALPILAITGHDQPVDLSVGAAQLRGVLRKPWGESELAAALAACGDLHPRVAISLASH
jgi:CheY-like chemotaxis protein